MLFRGYSAEEKLAIWSWPPDERGCIEWVGGTNGKGYGRLRVGGIKRAAHRVAYELAKGQIPPGYEPDHLCRNTLCVNADHLEAVTKRVNILRGFGAPAQHARKTHCKHGHPLSGDNLRIRHGVRRCQACKSARDLRDRGATEHRGSTWRSQITECPAGHLYDDANTYWSTPSKRQCRACNRAAVARYAVRKRGAEA